MHTIQFILDPLRYAGNTVNLQEAVGKLIWDGVIEPLKEARVVRTPGVQEHLLSIAPIMEEAIVQIGVLSYG